MIEEAPKNLWHKSIYILIILFSFICMYQLWNLNVKELQGSEGFYATSMAELEYLKLSQLPTAHGIGVINAKPLYPYLCKILHDNFNLSIEYSLRLISFLWIFATAVATGLTAGLAKGFKAGVVAFCFFLGCMFVFEKSLFGYPVSMGVFFVFLAHVLWLYFGFVKRSWDLAWVFSLITLSIAFLSAGFVTLIYFFLPLFFTHRPLKAVKKLSTWGFYVGFSCLLMVVLAWLQPYIFSDVELIYENSIIKVKDFKEYFLDIICTPFALSYRLLPWSLIMWLPFCVALRPLDGKPIFSHYYRVLFFTNFIFSLVNPFGNTIDLLYAFAPLAVITGLSYDSGVRRYSNEIRKLMILGSYLTFGLGLVALGFCFYPQSLLQNELPVLCLAILLMLQGIWIYYYRKHGQIWLILLTISISIGMFFYSTIHIYRTIDQSRREIATEINKVLEDETAHKIYKYGIRDFYNEGGYLNHPIQRIFQLEELPKDEKHVYVLSVVFPEYPNRTWESLIKKSYREFDLTLWKGTLIERADFVNKIKE